MDPRLRFELDQLLALLLGALFLGTGIAKIVGPDFLVDTFGEWEYAAWTLMALGAVEIVAAVLTVIPATRRLGAAAIGVLMLGAVGYHLARGELALVPLPAFVLVVSAVLVIFELMAKRDALGKQRPAAEREQARSGSGGQPAQARS